MDRCIGHGMCPSHTGVKCCDPLARRAAKMPGTSNWITELGVAYWNSGAF